jgi:ribulose-phosphate 3-epimerase
MREIIPAIMPQSLEDLHAELALVKNYVSMVQIDIMDGTFVRSKSWPYINDHDSFGAVIAEEEGLPFWQDVDFEIDLMVAHPEEVVEQWIAAGAKRIVVHVESTNKIQDIVNIFKERFAYAPDTKTRDIELGLALDILTPTEKVLSYLEDIDFIQFMGIDKIGYQGESFDQQVIDKIREFHNAHPEIVLSIDGGVSLETAPLLTEIGVKRFVAGSAIFESDNIKHTIEEFRNILSGI